MALNKFVQDLQFTSRNAAKLSKKLGEFIGTPEMFLGMAAERLDGQDQTILLSELSSAIGRSEEYNDPLLRERLINVFSRPEIIQYRQDGVDIRNSAMAIAGNWGDVQQGIDAARAALGLGMLTREQATLFWKERIYRPAREGLMRPQFFKKNVGYYVGAKKGERIPFDYVSYGIMKYRATIEARLSAWGDKAPFWLWLNYGNVGGGQYPTVAPTNFVENAENQINALLQAEMIKLADEFSQAVSSEVQNFLNNPQSYQPGTELSRFNVMGRQFSMGVTPGGELSVRRTS